MTSLLSEFINFPRERELVGRMLLAYGELEFALLGCVSEALNDDIHTTTRILFRVRGEAARLSVADAILRPLFSKYPGLTDKWITAYAVVRHCKNIRNQYAHCHWQRPDDGKLYFLNLDEEAKSSGEVLNVTFRPIDLVLLQKQYEYFEYAAGWLYHLRDQLILRAGKTPTGLILPEPKSIPQPPLDSHQAKAAPSPPAGRA